MADFSVQQALSKTYFEALHSYHQGGLTNGGGIAGIQRPAMDRFDATGTQTVPNDEPVLQASRSDLKNPGTMTTWTRRCDREVQPAGLQGAGRRSEAGCVAADVR